MKGSATPEKAIAFTRLSVALTCCWPPRATASKTEIFRFKVLRSMCLLSATMLLLPLIYTIYANRTDVVILAKSICLAAAVSQIIMQTALCACQYERLQRLIEEMEMCCKNAVEFEREILQRYVDRCTAFYGGSVIWFYLSACVVVLGTLLLSQPFPTDAKYPFPVDFFPVNCIVFVHQSFVGVQCAAQVCTNTFGALLLWFAAARFEMLMVELRTVTNVRKLITCIKKHQHLVSYAKEVAAVVRFIAFVTIGISTSALILSGLTFVSKQPLTVKVQFMCLSGTALLEVFMCAWPADHLINMSIDVVQGAYESRWYEQTVEMQKYVLNMLLGSQKPVTVAISGILSTLSLNYYCAYLSNAFSFFTAIRVMVEDDN